MKPRGPLTDEQTRARLRDLEQEDARIMREIDALTSKRARLRAEAAALIEQLRGQLELPLASTRPAPAAGGQRAA